MNTHLIGDSHVLMHLNLENDFFKTHHFGACTAYGLLTPKSKTKSLTTMLNFTNKILNRPNNEEKIIFLFGEIDCRVLIYFMHIEYNLSILHATSVCTSRYFGAIEFVYNMGIQVGVHGILPAVLQGNDYKVKHYGDPNTRGSINYTFSKQMEDKCGRFGFPFFDCYQFYELYDDRKAIKPEYLLPDKVHLDPTKTNLSQKFKEWMIQEKFYNETS